MIQPGTEYKELNILLIDDNHVDTYIHERLFMLYGVAHCTSFNSSYKALEHLRHTRTRYDYIVVDIYMPEMNGFSFIEHVRRLQLDEKHGQMLIVSISLNPADREKANNLDVMYFEKPFKIEKLFGNKPLLAS